MIQYRLGTVTDVDAIYASYALEFPENERKTKGQLEQLMIRGAYTMLIAEEQMESSINRIGFSCLYVPDNENFVWLDYLVIERAYQSKGYGSIFFREMMERWQSRKGMYIEIEIPSGDNVNQLRRIAYYERLGAKRLPIKYHLPTEIDEMEMFLYFKPQSTESTLTLDEINKAIVWANQTIHWDHADLKGVWEKNRMQI